MPPHWIRLLIGPTATRILERAERAPQTLSVEDVAVLAYLLGAAYVRGTQLDGAGKLSKKQQRDLAGLGAITFRLRDELADAGIDSQQVESLAMKRLANPYGRGVPEREVELALRPANERSRILVERIVDLYQPVFSYEPRVELVSDDGQLRVVVVGPDPDLVDNLAGTIYLTLGANKYEGKRHAPPAILARVSNPAKPSRGQWSLNPAALASLATHRQRNVSSLRRRLSR